MLKTKEQVKTSESVVALLECIQTQVTTNTTDCYIFRMSYMNPMATKNKKQKIDIQKIKRNDPTKILKKGITYKGS